MTTTSDITHALMTRMIAFDGVAADRIAWQGLGFYRAGAWTGAEPEGGYWIETSLHRTPPQNRFIGLDSPAHREGWFQATCVTRRGAGTLDLETLADQVSAHFPIGGRYTHNGVTVRITRTPGPESPFEDDGRVRVVVKVFFLTLA